MIYDITLWHHLVHVADPHLVEYDFVVVVVVIFVVLV